VSPLRAFPPPLHSRSPETASLLLPHTLGRACTFRGSKWNGVGILRETTAPAGSSGT
jgi:hypothetical protein